MRQNFEQEVKNVHVIIDNLNEKNKQMAAKGIINIGGSVDTNISNTDMSLNHDVNKEQSKTKQKKKKVKKQDITKKIIEEFEKDCEDILIMKKNCGFDLNTKKCKKCYFEIYSEGLLRQHKVQIHSLKESPENIFLGFKNDLIEHVNLLKSMEDDVKLIRCKDCEFETYSKGLLEIHKNDNH